MARKLELKTIPVVPPVTPNGSLRNGADQSAETFSYAVMIQSLLRNAPPGGLSFNDVVRSVEALRPIEEAIAAEAESVTLSEEQYRTLRGKLDQFQFVVADQVIVDFGMMIRNAPEIGTT
jgi:hypothetical protein